MTSHTIEYLTSPELAGLYWPGVVTGVIIAISTAALSVLTVLKRMTFIGQGVSHAAFGGVGLAAILGLIGGGSAAGTFAQFAVVFGFCFLAALLMGMLGRAEASGGGGHGPDSAIGIVLVASMAVGAILVRLSGRNVSWETFLFGDILAVGWPDTLIAGVAGFSILLTLLIVRRPMLFHAFDPAAAAAWGVRGVVLDRILMLVLALAVVTAMKLAGVVLATALLVLPGATALRLSRRFGPVLWLAHGIALAGVVLGTVISFEVDLPTGPAIVSTLVAIFAVAVVASRFQGSSKGQAQ